MAASKDTASTVTEGDTISIVIPPLDVPAVPATFIAETGTETKAQPVTSTLDDLPPTPPAAPVEETCFGLQVRDCTVLLALGLLCLGLSVWHWGQLSGWGLTPVEVDRLPERVYDYRIDINEATFAEWLQMPGIGETLAQRILEYREEQGRLESVDELDNIKGIGPKTLAKLRPWLIVREAESESESPSHLQLAHDP